MKTLTVYVCLVLFGHVVSIEPSTNDTLELPDVIKAPLVDVTKERIDDVTTESNNDANILLYKLVRNNFRNLLSVFRTDDDKAVGNGLLSQAAGEGSGGLMAVQGVSQQCEEDYNLTMANFDINNLNKSPVWALAIMDAWGKLPANMLGGNFKWLGDIDECEQVKAVVADEEIFTGKYCRASLNLGRSIPMALMMVGASNTQLGACISHRCSNTDLLLLMKDELKNQGSEVTVRNVVCKEPRELQSDAVAVIIFLSILLTLMAFGTIYDVLVVQLGLTTTRSPTQHGYTSLGSPAPYSQPGQAHSHIDQSRQSLLTSYDQAESTDIDKASATANGYGTMGNKETPDNIKPSGFTVATTKPDRDEKKEAPKGLLSQMLLAFSIYTNGSKLLSANKVSGTLGAINGIRFISMGWVILGHSFVYALSYMQNQAGGSLKFFSRLSFCAVAYATVSVDSFFVLSGVLVGYLTLKEFAKVGGPRRLNWAMFYFHRFWRLTPPYMLVILVATVLWPYFSSGAMFLDPKLDTHSEMKWCRDNWWTNMLYINNLVKTNELCMGHSWYLANDMQFYIISPLILVPIFMHVVAGGIACAIFLIGTVITTAVIVHDHEYSAQMGPGIQGGGGLNTDSFRDVYIPSYTRMGPYIVGLLTGYLLYRLKCKCRIPVLLSAFLWCGCLCICTVIVYVPFTDDGNHIFTNMDSTFYTALHRTGWGVAVAWIIFACATGNGGWIDQLLSWSPFTPLGRLTYCAYLIHPIVMIVYFENRVNPLYFDNYNLIYMFLGHMVLTYGAAFVISLMFESPMMGLEKVLIRNDRNVFVRSWSYISKTWKEKGSYR